MGWMIAGTQKTVGNAADAERAACGALTFLDDGLFKKVYVDPDERTVYKIVSLAKVHVPEDRACALANLRAECEEAIRLQAEGVRGIPDVTLWRTDDGRDVLAMPYMPGGSYKAEQHPDFAEIANDWECAGLEDLHGGNYAADADGFPFVIDLAGWAYDYVTDEDREAAGSTDDEDSEWECDGYCGGECEQCQHAGYCPHNVTAADCDKCNPEPHTSRDPRCNVFAWAAGCAHRAQTPTPVLPEWYAVPAGSPTLPLVFAPVVAQAPGDLVPEHVVHMRCQNDANGNPRRVYVVFASGQHWAPGVLRRVAVFDEGYAGRHCMPTWARALPELRSEDISLKEYRILKGEAERR